jgi:CheY-like chemotaxis protein
LSRGTERARVLLIDDSVEHLDLYASMLRHAATVVTAARGEDGVAIARIEPPHAIVLDVMMPGMDGWQVCALLKANPATADIPVIMLTSLDAVDVPLRARAAGAVAVLMKPCPLDRLLLTIDRAIRPDATHPN